MTVDLHLEPLGLLTQNSELRDDGIWNWTLPALSARLPSGRRVTTCPTAGACARACYALNGTYRFPASIEAHTRNLMMVTGDLPGWVARMLSELQHPRYARTGRPTLPDLPRGHLHPEVRRLLDQGARAVRIHDSGDFFTDNYLHAWLTIARAIPNVIFYAYTKEVRRLRAAAADAPPNFLWVYSLGGKEDHLVDRDRDRHADVFPDPAAIAAAGYYDQSAHDLLAVVAPSLRIGIPANNIPRFRKRQAGRTFSEMEEETTRRRRTAETHVSIPTGTLPTLLETER